MNRHRFGWTLIELLLVMAILALLMALFYPAIASAKAGAEKAVCIEHFREVTQGTLGYLNDYDDVFTPVSQDPMDAVSEDVRKNPNDHTWVQLLLPYTEAFSLFVCPSDYTRADAGLDAFDNDIVPSNLYIRFHEASMRVNTGFNYMALSPIVRDGSSWVNMPNNYSAVSDPSSTFIYLDSAHSVNKNGIPKGGGSWLVDPPCRYVMSQSGSYLDMFSAGGRSFGEVFSMGAWSQTSGLPYGGAFPWHKGMLTVAKTDGSVVEKSIGSLTQGCNPQTQILTDNDPFGENYPWSITH